MQLVEVHQLQYGIESAAVHCTLWEHWQHIHTVSTAFTAVACLSHYHTKRSGLYRNIIALMTYYYSSSYTNVRDWRSTPTYCQLQSHVTKIRTKIKNPALISF